MVVGGGDATAAVVDGKVVMNKASADEIKEKMEQQLRIQRAAHQQKRALEMKNPQGQMIKMVATTAQGKPAFLNRYVGFIL